LTLTIWGGMSHANGLIEITEDAARRARVGHNPSNLASVNRLKTLAAAFYTECNAIACEAISPGAVQEINHAMMQIQTGAMFAVSAATAQLDKQQPSTEEGYGWLVLDQHHTADEDELPL
jgi:hypothetical protein